MDLQLTLTDVVVDFSARTFTATIVDDVVCGDDVKYALAGLSQGSSDEYDYKQLDANYVTNQIDGSRFANPIVTFSLIRTVFGHQIGRAAEVTKDFNQ